MCTPSRLTRALCSALLAAACMGCATVGETPVPRGWLSPAGPGGPGGDGYGAWVMVRSRFDRSEVLSGELIVVRIDSLWVLTETGLRSRAMSHVGSVRMYTGVSETGHAIVEDAVPVHEGAITRPDDASIASARAADLRPWARFPAGWPPGLDPAALQPKPVSKR